MGREDTLTVLRPQHLKGVYRASRNRTANMDALATSTAPCWWSGCSRQAFFDSSAAVITFTLLGRYVEARAKLRAGHVIWKLVSL